MKFREKRKNIREKGEIVEKIREEGAKWVIKQGEGIFVYLSLSLPYVQVATSLYFIPYFIQCNEF